MLTSTSVSQPQHGICGIVFGFVYDSISIPAKSLGGIRTLTSTRAMTMTSGQNNAALAHKMAKCHRGYEQIAALSDRIGSDRIGLDLRCYRGALRGGVDFDKCLINFVPRSNIKPGYFLT